MVILFRITKLALDNGFTLAPLWLRGGLLFRAASARSPSAPKLTLAAAKITYTRLKALVQSRLASANGQQDAITLPAAPAPTPSSPIPSSPFRHTVSESGISLPGDAHEDVSAVPETGRRESEPPIPFVPASIGSPDIDEDMDANLSDHDDFMPGAMDHDDDGTDIYGASPPPQPSPPQPSPRPPPNMTGHNQSDELRAGHSTDNAINDNISHAGSIGDYYDDEHSDIAYANIETRPIAPEIRHTHSGTNNVDMENILVLLDPHLTTSRLATIATLLQTSSDTLSSLCGRLTSQDTTSTNEAQVAQHAQLQATQVKLQQYLEQRRASQRFLAEARQSLPPAPSPSSAAAPDSSSIISGVQRAVQLGIQRAREQVNAAVSDIFQHIAVDSLAVVPAELQHLVNTTSDETDFEAALDKYGEEIAEQLAAVKKGMAKHQEEMVEHREKMESLRGQIEVVRCSIAGLEKEKEMLERTERARDVKRILGFVNPEMLARILEA